MGHPPSKPEHQQPRSPSRRFEVRPSSTYGSFLTAREAASVPGERSAVAEGVVESLLRQPEEQRVLATPGATEDRAVWVVHGMGQQVPFETLEQVADGLIAAAARAGAECDPPGFSEMRVEKTVLQRVELGFTCRGEAKRIVHVYESYWAPKTEGVPKLTDVMSLLWNGGFHGLVNFFVGFERALFSRVVSFRVPWRTPVYLLAVMLLLASLVTMNTIILATGGKSLGIAHLPALTPSELVGPLTAVAAIVSAVAISFGALLFLATIARPGGFFKNLSESLGLSGPGTAPLPRLTRAAGWFYQATIEWLIWIAVILTGATLVAGAGVMLYITRISIPDWLTPELGGNAQAWSNMLALLAIAAAILGAIGKRIVAGKYDATRGRFRQLLMWYFPFLYIPFCLGFLIFIVEVAGVTWLAWRQGGAPWNFPCPGILRSSAWVWPFLILISAQIRTLVVEYVGDVAVYVTSNKLDRFDAVRQAIKELAKESASAVYSAMANATTFQYKKVAVVGHSLGSVIAYDTLNRLLADDLLRTPVIGIATRTSVFVTFGCPLDKIAFLFSIMGKKTRHIREQLAAVVQPLIERPEFRRRIPWVNVYTHNDVICGSLEYFDFPRKIRDDPPPELRPLPGVRTVKNLVDEDAVVPLVAHVDYWRNAKVWDELWKRMWR